VLGEPNSDLNKLLYRPSLFVSLSARLLVAWIQVLTHRSTGAFFSYIYRFVDPSLGFAVGWDYAIGWLTVLPFELTAASITIEYWRDDIHVSVWITVFMVFLILVQIFGVLGYGEVEFVLSMIKVTACIGFIIFGIIANCGGVPTDHRGYIGARYWHNPGAFQNGFKGFCTYVCV
jgi:yeast amino acid transporter